MFEILICIICWLLIQQDICNGLRIVSSTKNSWVRINSSVTLYCETDLPFQICKWKWNGNSKMRGCDFCGIDDQKESTLRSDVPPPTCCDDYFVTWNATSRRCGITLENGLQLCTMNLGVFSKQVIFGSSALSFDKRKKRVLFAKYRQEIWSNQQNVYFQ